MSNENNPRTTSGVPPPPKLTFPTIYNGEKILSKAQSQWKPLQKAVAPSYDPVTGRLPQDIHDFVLDILDFRTLSRDNRQALLVGSTVQWMINDEVVADVPLRLLLAASQEARNVYLTPPQQPIVSMNINTKNGRLKDALKKIVYWMKDTCTKNKAYYIPTTNFTQDVNLIAVAATVGMDIYVNHIIKPYLNALKNDNLVLSQLIVIANAAPNPEFPLLTCIIDRLSTELVKGERSTQDHEFRYWMQQCPRVSNLLKPKYDQQLAEYQNKLQADAEKARKASEKKELKATAKMAKALLKAQHQRGEQQRQGMKEELERAKAEREAEKHREKQLKVDLNRKLNSGRINTITAEEAKYLARWGSSA